MVTTPILQLPNFNKEFKIETDALDVGIGAVLMQDNLPLAYHSWKLGPCLQRSSAYLKELHAVTEVVAKWRQCLIGRHFRIHTDHKSLKEILQQ